MCIRVNPCCNAGLCSYHCDMDTPELRKRLARLVTAQIKALAKAVSVSERALWNIRSGKTKTASEYIRDAVKGKIPRSKEKKQ